MPVNDERSAYHSQLQTMLQAKANLKATNETKYVDGREETICEKHDDPKLPGEAKSAMKDMYDMNANANFDLTLE